ncbi:hypothetical protein [Conexivisphaera calida]|uniref:hypothetical protein n=1 Tax=Conexivisphaera calida TaxID=1874277 RepID=UPI00157B1339|nr:hypothetical protein [Conexivisphaera calida]
MNELNYERRQEYFEARRQGLAPCPRITGNNRGIWAAVEAGGIGPHLQKAQGTLRGLEEAVK